MTHRQPSREEESDEGVPLDKGTSVVEWIAAACGAAVFAAMIGYMAYAGIHEVAGTPEIELVTTDAVRKGDQYLVGFTATNIGEATATDLTLRATLADGEKEVETQDLTIDYLPRQSSRSGGFFFSRNPEGLKVTVAATSYLDP